ncbi:MAG TPA: YetF domain-containing protein, partial [Niastella sp.]
MDKKFIHLNDFYRILLGEVPPEFYIELIIRTVVVYALITFGMKYLGKRTAAELSRSELAAISTLAATTGLVLLSPDRGLVSSVIVLIVILLIRKLVNKRNYQSQRFEVLVEGKRSTLVIDGELQWQEMQKVRVSKEQLFSHIREFGIVHLGLVSRLYM